MSPSESTAIHCALAYWLAHWDWEAPLLFGLTAPEFEAVSSEWLSIADSLQPAGPHCRAAVGALRELLYGACALPPARVEQILGIEQAEAALLLNRLYEHCRAEF